MFVYKHYRWQCASATKLLRDIVRKLSFYFTGDFSCSKTVKEMPQNIFPWGIWGGSQCVLPTPCSVPWVYFASFLSYDHGTDNVRWTDQHQQPTRLAWTAGQQQMTFKLETHSTWFVDRCNYMAVSSFSDTVMAKCYQSQQQRWYFINKNKKKTSVNEVTVFIILPATETNISLI